jgi:hypothetical protein
MRANIDFNRLIKNPTQAKRRPFDKLKASFEWAPVEVWLCGAARINA